MRVLSCSSLFCLLGSLIAMPAWAAVYSYTEEDGTLFLSNVPADARYVVLIPGPGDTPVRAQAAAVRVAAATRKSDFNNIIDKAAHTYAVDSALLHAVITVESHYNPKAVSKQGAIGLMQLMPGTAKRYGVSDAFDPAQNIRGGAQYLGDLLKMFNSDKDLALAAYNAGENAVIRSGNRIPHIRETAEYVPKVLNYYRKYLVDL